MKMPAWVRSMYCQLLAAAGGVFVNPETGAAVTRTTAATAANLELPAAVTRTTNGAVGFLAARAQSVQMPDAPMNRAARRHLQKRLGPKRSKWGSFMYGPTW